MNNDIILIRGLFRGQYHWGGFYQRLKANFPRRNIVAVDIPGTGKLSSQRSPCQISNMVESIRSQIHPNSPVDIIAISMGGMIAMKWAEMYPEEINHTICINTTCRNFSPFYQRLKPTNYFKIFKALCSNPERRESIIYSMVSNTPISTVVIEEWVRLSTKYPTTTMNFFRQLWAAITFKAKHPVKEILFIASQKDHLVSHIATEAPAKQWDMPLVLNYQDGHDIPLDNPRWLCDEVSRYLRSN